MGYGAGISAQRCKMPMTIPIKRRTPLLGENPDYSRGFWPDPPSHDFCVWLIIAELMRRHHKAPGPLKVRFGFIKDQLGSIDFGPFGVKDGRAYPCGVSKEYHDTMLANVLRPAMEMIGAVEEPTLHAPFKLAEIADHVEYDYHLSNLVDASRAGFDIPKWTVPQWAMSEAKSYLGGKRPIVITLREAPSQPERNSNMAEWLKFAGWAKARSYPVLFVRDTAKACEPLLGNFPVWHKPATNVFVRAALYQHALVNMFVGNGPTIWCMFSDAPYLIFKQLVPALPGWAHGQPHGWKEQDHMEPGQQYPWALPTQRLTWTDDTFENIKSAFEAFMEGK